MPNVSTRPAWFALAILLPVGATAQGPGGRPPLTLSDAIAMAQRQGAAARGARAARDDARYRDDAFNARLRPQLFVSGNVADLNHRINPITRADGLTQFVGQAQNQSSLQVGFSQKIPWTDGTISVSSAASRLDQYGLGKTPAARYYQTSPLIVSLQQSLFKPRNAIWDRRVQSLSASAADRGYLEAREDVAGAAADAFFNLYAQEMTLANVTANAAVNDTLYTLNKGRFTVGKIGENDLLKSELALLRSRAAVEDARLARDRAEAALRRIIAYPDGQPLAIVQPDSIPAFDADPEVAVAQALKNSSVIDQNALDVVTTKRGTAQARSNNRFNATIVASAGFNQTAGTLGLAYHDPLGQQAVTVGVQVPLVQWGAGRAEVQAALTNETRAAAANQARLDALAEDARFSALQLRQARRNIVLAAKADTVAAKQFEVARNRYTVSKISNTDLYNAQDEKDAAVLAYVQALRTYWTAYYHLRRVTLYDFAAKQPLSE